MTCDSWSLHRDLSCPECHVLGKVISRTPDDDENYKVCVECGMTWMDGSCVRPDDIKEMRLHWSRLDEGRPYEEPEHFEAVGKTPFDLSFMEQMLKDYYGPHRDTLGPTQWSGVPVTADPNVPSGIWGVGVFLPADSEVNFHRGPRVAFTGSEPGSTVEATEEWFLPADESEDEA
jgi:hypothetical protein